MNFNIGNIYNGFKLIEIKDLKEIGSKGYIFNHEKTGAKLIKIANDDDNKVFSIGFRTPPANDTGVPHILEHSVLCGSRKFDTKEPFVELLKGSLNTFLNAMTYPDKTIYPVASRNEKDYFNLMDVYLDAVLYPNIYKYKEIFMQEGWHYSIEDKNAPLKYNGVVYNEMKGAYSSPDSILYRSIPETIYPDTCYAYSSGGDPDSIPNLTYEEFLEFHKKYYHPSNSYIYLYGNEDLLKELEFINDKYLTDFNMENIDSKIDSQKSFKEMVEKRYKYGVSENDTLEGKSYYSLNFVVGESTDYELYLAFEVLSYLLLRSTAAPLKKALVEAGIGKAVSGDYDNCIKQPSFTVLVKNADVNLEEKFKKVTMDTLKKLVEEGIDKELIEASINRIEFELREGDYGSYPKGLVYYLKVMDSWLYEGKPFIHLEYDKALDRVKTALNKRYFEELIEKYMINNPHSSLVSLHPEKGFNERKERISVEKLEKIKEKMDDKELEQIIDNCKKLKERQSKPDTEEALKCIPALSLKDINKETEKLPLEEKTIDDIKVLHHSFNTNKISYVNLFFKTLCVEQDHIPYIALLSDILGKCGTDKYDYSKLSNKININTGGISYSPITFSSLDNIGEYTPYLEVSFKCLDSKIENTLEILSDILLDSNLNDLERIKQIIAEKRARLEGAIFDNGHRIVAKKVLSYSYSKGAYDEVISGLKYYEFLVELDENFNEEKISNTLKQVRDAIFNKNNLLVSFSGMEEEYTNFTKYFNKFSKKLSSKAVKKCEYSFELCHKNEGLLTQGNVQYVAKGGNFRQCGYDYNGALSLLETILGFDYLWNNVRVKGGAYGVFSNFRRDGGAYIVSYRDPNIKETIEVYDNTSVYIANFEANEREMTKYVIGTIRKHDQPINNSIKGDIATAHYLTGLTYEMLQKEREEIINADLVTVRSFAPLVNDLMKSDYLCVIGNENKIKENSYLFNKLYKVIK